MGFVDGVVLDSAAKGEAMAPEQHLLVEGDDEVRLFAPVGDGPVTEADPDAAGTRARAGRRLDLGRDDLHGPDAVAGLRTQGGEELARGLRAFAGIADDLDDLLARDRTGAAPHSHQNEGQTAIHSDLAPIERAV